jgi:hypothetical protein
MLIYINIYFNNTHILIWLNLRFVVVAKGAIVIIALQQDKLVGDLIL